METAVVVIFLFFSAIFVIAKLAELSKLEDTLPSRDISNRDS